MVGGLGVDKKLKGNLLRKELGELLAKGKVVPLPELVVRKPPSPKNKKNQVNQAEAVPKAKLLGGDWVELAETDVRNQLMAWLRSPENPYFAKAIVNRVWASYFGVGIVNPPDDLNLANAPSNGPLLDYLATGFIAHNYDLKWLHREIVNSDAYQRSWIPNETNATDKTNFSHSQLRRLTAEATFDAVRMALASDNWAGKARELDAPRAITEAGSSARTNNRDDQSYALNVFGRSVRESNCDCDRSSEPSLLQTVFLLNDKAVQDWLNDPKTSWVSEVAERFDWQKQHISAAAGAPTEMQEQMLERLVMQLERIDALLVKAGEAGRQKQTRLLEERKAELLERARIVAEKHGLSLNIEELLHGEPTGELAVAKPTHRGITDEQAQWIAENAYLRSLSRKPREDELARVVSHLRSEAEPAEAVAGLMWSLINTKEFILNH